MTKSAAAGRLAAHLEAQPATNLTTESHDQAQSGDGAQRSEVEPDASTAPSERRANRSTPMQAALLAQLMQPSPQPAAPGAHDGQVPNEVPHARGDEPERVQQESGENSDSVLPPDSADIGSVSQQTGIYGLDDINAECFATSYIYQMLQTLEPGTNVLVLSDGRESKSAGTFCLDYSHLNIYSTDHDYPETLERIDMFGMGYFRIKLDNTKPINAGVFGSPETKFGSIVLLKGLCDHQEWKDIEGKDAGPVGCGGVQLSAEGVSSLLSSVTLLLEDHGRFALHGEINSRDRLAEHQALRPEVQQAIIAGVQRFNDAYGAPLANVHVGDTGLVISGEKSEPLSQEQTDRLESMVQEYFSADRTVTCGPH